MHTNEDYLLAYLLILGFDLPLARSAGQSGRYLDKLMSEDPERRVEEDGVNWRRYRHHTVQDLEALLHPSEALVRIKCPVDGVEKVKDFRYAEPRDLDVFKVYVEILESQRSNRPD